MPPTPHSQWVLLSQSCTCMDCAQHSLPRPLFRQKFTRIPQREGVLLEKQCRAWESGNAAP